LQPDESSIFYNHFVSFWAQDGFVNAFGTKELTILKDGSIESEGHVPSEKGFRLDGATGVIDSVGMTAKDGEFTGTFKAQSLETVDNVPSISHLNDFSVPASNTAINTSKINGFYNYRVKSVIASAEYRILSRSGEIVYGTSDGITFENLGELGAIENRYSLLFWDSKFDVYYTIGTDASSEYVVSAKGPKIKSTSWTRG
jgi:hypothetical protein